MKQVDYNLDTEILNDLPNIVLEFTYQDEFSNDHYILRSNPNFQDGTNNLKFEVVKNGKKQNGILLFERNVKNMINEFFEVADDMDFKEEFNKTQICESVSVSVNDFLKRYDDIVVSTELVIEGELKRMQEMAGLLL